MELIIIFKYLINIFTLLIFFILFICLFFIPTLFSSYSFVSNLDTKELSFSPNGFIWPTPGYTRINSFFGKRNAPTAGASTFHKGIDIGAPEGAAFIAVTDGKITFTNFLGGGGYTITLTSR